MGAIQNAPGLIVCRFLLGAIEAGQFPGIIFFTSLWYTKRQQGMRVDLFWSFSALAGVFAYGIGQMSSAKLPQWRLIFIVS
jgi:ACS family allantoate permease-like MFS transporter